MAQIPDVTSLGSSPIPRSARGIVPSDMVDQSAAIEAESLGRFAENVGGIARQFGEREDKFNYAQAKSSLLQADIAARKSLENDNDWSTYETRYQESMSKALEGSAKMIRGNRDRSLFEMDSKLDVERGLQEIRGKAKVREVDWGRSTTDQTLEANRAAAMNAPDDITRQAVLSASKEAIIGAKEKGYYSEQEATNLFQGFRDSYATGYLAMQPAEKRIEMLSGKNTVAEYLQPDVRAKLLEHAKNESRELRVRRESQAAEDSIVAKLGPTPAALAEARKIADPEVRDSTVSRIKAREVEAKQRDIESRDALGEEALRFINDGGRFADLPLRIKNGLKPSALSSLRSYAESGKRATAPETLVELSSHFADDPQSFGETDLLAYRDRLSDNDFEKFVDLQRKVRSGNVDGKASGFQSITQVKDAKLRELFGGTTAKGDKQTRINNFTTQFEAELKSFKEETGKAARTDDARKILDNLTAEVSINWGSDKRVYELKDGDIPDVPAAERAEIIRELQKRGKPVTDAAIISLYKRVNIK